MDRRDFLKTTTLASAGAIFEPGGFAQVDSTLPIAIQLTAPTTTKTTLAVRELSSGLRLLNPAWRIEPGGESRGLHPAYPRNRKLHFRQFGAL